MKGINRQITVDVRHIVKHLPGTPQIKRLLKKGIAAHVFNDEKTMNRVAQCIIEEGEFLGIVRDYERYGMFFTAPIGYRISPDGSNIPTIPLYYGEIKINADNQIPLHPTYQT